MRERMLLQMLNDVMRTPLHDGLRLADVPAARRLVELEFHLPAQRLDAAALQALLRRLKLPVPGLSFPALHGYLHGFIDLVFEHAGRYYVLDWKSNHLGDRPDDYAAQALHAAMARQGYHLQALLYALALHRHLQQRRPGYRHDAQFGGVLYLFVRGVRPAWRQADGSAAGVHFHRPTLQALQQLEALLGGGGP
jgi:exodeoxyribonuclease V beta subunit